MKVAYIFSTQNSHYILQNMIVPQLEENMHGFDVAGMFFFVDNTFLLVKGNELGERISYLSEQKGFLLMACNKCAHDRCITNNLVKKAILGCFPELHSALDGKDIDQVITL